MRRNRRELRRYYNDPSYHPEMTDEWVLKMEAALRISRTEAMKELRRLRDAVAELATKLNPNVGLNEDKGEPFQGASVVCTELGYVSAKLRWLERSIAR